MQGVAHRDLREEGAGAPLTGAVPAGSVRRTRPSRTSRTDQLRAGEGWKAKEKSALLATALAAGAEG